MTKKAHNHNYLEKRQKALRNNLTSAEATLWKHLERKQLYGRKFRRQHSIQNYIVDFYCASEKLIIEMEFYLCIKRAFPKINLPLILKIS